MSLVAFRVVIGAVVLYLLMVVRGQRLPRGWAHWKMGGWLAVVGIGLPFFLISWGQTRVESGMAAILMAVMPLATMVMIAGAVLSVTAALVLDGPYGLLLGTESLWTGVYLGVLPNGLATIIYFHLIEARGATFFAFVNYLNPVFGVMWGAALLGEVLTTTVLGALATILLGITVANVKFGLGET